MGTTTRIATAATNMPSCAHIFDATFCAWSRWPKAPDRWISDGRSWSISCTDGRSGKRTAARRRAPPSWSLEAKRGDDGVAFAAEHERPSNLGGSRGAPGGCGRPLSPMAAARWGSCPAPAMGRSCASSPMLSGDAGGEAGGEFGSKHEGRERPIAARCAGDSSPWAAAPATVESCDCWRRSNCTGSWVQSSLQRLTVESGGRKIDATVTSSM
mmetsp:Transcript_120052/g.346807  ORF Transcript_120052/g.346807 Transcript_120052/m.346807 type:complete len:213 (-) Transcript_120052:290-928(-)